MYITILIIHFGCVFFLSLVYNQRELDKIGKFIFGILILSFAIIVAARPDTVVPDAESYHFRYISATSSISFDEILHTGLLSKVTHYSMNVGASFISFLFALLGIPYEMYCFTVALLEIVFFLYFQRKICEILDIHVNAGYLFLVSLVMYGYYYMLIAFAQGLAMLFVVISFYFYLKRKYIRCFIFVFVSLLFHYVGAIGLVIIGIYHYLKRFRKRTYRIVWAICTALLLSGLGFQLSRSIEEVVHFMVLSMSKFNPLLAFYDEVNTTGNIAILTVVVFAYIGVMTYGDCENKIYWKMMNVLFVSMVVSVVFTSWEIVHRINDVLLLMIIPTSCIYKSEEFNNRIRIKKSNVIFSYVFIILSFMSFIRIIFAYNT